MIMKQKVYIVESRSMGMSTMVGIFSSKMDAEFLKWKHDKRDGVNYTYSSSIEEQVVTSDMDRSTPEFKKFSKDYLKQIDKEIAQKEQCSEKDNEQIKVLKEEKEYLENK